MEAAGGGYKDIVHHRMFQRTPQGCSVALGVKPSLWMKTLGNVVNAIVNHPSLGMVTIPPIYGELGGGLLLFYQHCLLLHNLTLDYGTHVQDIPICQRHPVMGLSLRSATRKGRHLSDAQVPDIPNRNWPNI